MSVSALPLLQNVIQTQKETPTVQNCRMIFIVGASRSGTTLLARMLGKHSNIAYVQETQFFDDIWPVRSANSVIGNDIGRKIVMRIVARALSGLLSVDQKILAEAVDSVIVRDADTTPARLYERTLLWVAAKLGKRAVVEHTPRNVYYLHYLMQYFPTAYFVCMVRDPRAVVASQKRRWRMRSLGATKTSRIETARVWANYHPYTACRLWIRAAECISDRPSAPRLTVVRYEDIVMAPLAALESIAASVGQSFEQTMLSVPQWGSSHQVHSATPGIDRTLIDHWREVLSSAETEIVENRCGVWMNRFGYVPENLGTRARRPLFDIWFPLHCATVLMFNPRRALVQTKSVFAGQD